jgi:hypothetical protein
MPATVDWTYVIGWTAFGVVIAALFVGAYLMFRRHT